VCNSTIDFVELINKAKESKKGDSLIQREFCRLSLEEISKLNSDDIVNGFDVVANIKERYFTVTLKIPF